MVKRLESMGLVEHEPYHGVQLTPAGERVALEVLRHHRLLELYLAEALGMSWDRVHEEAEVLEHAISPALSELIAAKLGNPTHDPHGDPIPTADGEIDETPTRAARRPGAGRAGVFVRVSDSDPDMLRYLAERGIAPGDRFEVLEREPFEGPLTVVFGEQLARPRRRAHPGDADRDAVNQPLEVDVRGGADLPALVGRAERRPSRARWSSCAAAGACATAWRCSARRSSPRSPTSTRATSPPTSPAAPSTATCCCG